MTFGEKVKAGRTKLGLTQEELANKIGVTVRVICSYEKINPVREEWKDIKHWQKLSAKM